MSGDDETAFRAKLDADGVLREDADLALLPARVFRVFSQEKWPQVRTQTWARFAERFTQTKLGITTDKHYGHRVVTRDAARVIVSRDDLRGTRALFGRAISGADTGDAEIAEGRHGYTGLSLLAARCKTVWLVEAEGPDDRAALLVAAILAGTELGPILTPARREGAELFGFKTAWTRVSESASPYR